MSALERTQPEVVRALFGEIDGDDREAWCGASTTSRAKTMRSDGCELRELAWAACS
jgi:hypothetical protein